jgi:hypothetical protein
MAEAWVEVANSALIKIGTQQISSLAQATPQARICLTRLPVSVNIILRKFPWKCAMTSTNLAQLSTPPPDKNFLYAYPIPTDCLRVWRYNPGSPLLGASYGSNFVIRQNQIWSNDGLSITGAGSSPSLTYVQNPYNSPARLDALCTEAIACQLAMDICYTLTESLPLKQDLQQQLKLALQNARTVDSMETPEVFEIDASLFLTARFAGTNYMGPNYPGSSPGMS